MKFYTKKASDFAHGKKYKVSKKHLEHLRFYRDQYQ
jgi:hypothetical protein